MKVLFYHPGLLLGGAETQLLTLSQELDKRGCDLVVLAQGGTANTTHWSALRNCARIIDVEGVESIAKAVRLVKPDVVQHFHNGVIDPALEMAEYEGVGIEVIHGSVHFPNDATRTSKVHTQHMVAVSEDAKEFFLRSMPDWDNRISVIPNGIDTQRFTPDRTQVPKDGPLRILHVGRICEGDKQYIKIIDACSALRRPWTLWCVGTGVDQKMLEEYADYHTPGKVNFLGYTSDPQHYYQQADIYISRSPSEGFGLSIAEAAASQLPITMWNCGGIAAYFTPGTNALIADNENEFVSNLQTLSVDTPKRLVMGKAARELAVHEFSSEMMGERYFKLYEWLITQKEKDARPQLPKRRALPPTNRLVVGISNPNFQGVSNAVRTWVGAHNWIPAAPDSAQQVFDVLCTAKPHVLILGGDSGYMPIVKAVRKHLPHIRIVMTWHGTFSFNSFAPGDSELLATWIEALHEGLIDRLGFVREGMAEAVKHPCAVYFPNRVPKIAMPPVPGRIEKRIHIGIFGTGYPWKNMQQMVIGANLIDRAIIHVNRLEDKRLPNLLGANIHEHGFTSQPSFHQLLATMDVNIQGSFTESFGLTFCESVLLGVPCATTPGVQVLPGYTHTQITDPDNPVEVANTLRRLIETPALEETRARLRALDRKNAEQIKKVMEEL